MMLPMVASAYDFELDGFYYNIISVSDLTLELTTDVEIKDILNDTDNNKKYYGDIIIPESVNYKGKEWKIVRIDYAFKFCSGITSVTIPSSVTEIGECSFIGCTSLKQIDLSGGIKNIGKWAFSRCGLEKLNIPNNVTHVSLCAFYDCNSLTEVIIEEGDESIYFEGGNNSGVGVFADCPNLEKAIINRNYTFQYYYTQSSTPPFRRCKGLRNIIIGDEVTSIPRYSFEGCTLLTDVRMSNNICSIDENAFEGCSLLESIDLPFSITAIADNVFKNCSSLKNTLIRNGMTSIGNSAYEGCTSILSVDIVKSINKIGANAFNGCTNIKEIFVHSPIPISDVEESSFNGSSYLDAVLYVPKGYIESYSNTPVWKLFFNIQEKTVDDGNMYYQLNITATGHGVATYGTTEVKNTTTTFDVAEAANATITIAPDDGYSISSVTVNGEDKTEEVVDGQLTISNVTANVVVNVSFITAGETASVSISSAGMATLCSTKDLDFTEVSGLKAYTGAGFNRTTGALTMLEVKDAPAGTGLVLIGSEGTYDIPVKPSASVYGNLLVGVTEDTQLAQTADGYTNYILGNGDHGLGFYIVTAEGGTLAAGKAYLRLPIVTANARRVISIEYGEGVTAVDGQRITSVESDGSFYTLNGQRMTGTPGKAGVYIKDGHKVIIK